MHLQYALIQHPMYLVIREDTACAERTPPWGEPTIEFYVERIRTNLQRLREFPQVKIGFEWSALELELLAQDAPDVLAEMEALAREGRVAFYNGTYAQPHLQVQSAEANIRQFELGQRIYRELVGAPVVTYAHQESSIHEQMPQILQAFGFEHSAVPHFPSNLFWLDGGGVLMRLGEPHFLREQEFVRWVGLDGTEIPLYLTPHRHPVSEWTTRETMAGLMRGPNILLENRDLTNMSAEWLAEREGAEPVLLDRAFRELLAITPPKARARHFTYWSYTEGIRAEELPRKNWIAERMVLRAEALDAIAFSLLGKLHQETDAVWKLILASQHHDAHCFCAPELRGKAIGWVEQAARQSEQMALSTAETIAAHVDTTQQKGMPLVVFSTLPQTQREVVTVRVPTDHLRLVDATGKVIPADAAEESEGTATLKFVTNTAGLGYATYWLQEGTIPRVTRNIQEQIAFENEFYCVTIQPDGRLSSLRLKPSGSELLAQDGMGGNFLRATDSTGISPQENPGLVNKPQWKIPPLPRELTWETSGALDATTSPLGMTLRIKGYLGEQICAAMTIELYDALPRIDFTYRFDFSNASVGIFYLDETKLRVGWKLGFRGNIYHDIPFGVVETEQNVPILPTRWTDVSDGTKGLAYFHQGTFKHWVAENTLFNVFAWGEETNAMGDRIWRENWAKSFDQRLNGSHVIHAALYPHAGNWRTGNVVTEATSYNAPPSGWLSQRHAGKLPPKLNLLRLGGAGIVATGVRVNDAQVHSRVYSVAEQPLVPTFESSTLALRTIQTLNNKSVLRIAPYEIGILRFVTAPGI